MVNQKPAERPAIPHIPGISPADLARIEAAVFEAERGTSAEIVPVIARRSMYVRHVPVLTGLLVAVLILLPEVRTGLEMLVPNVLAQWLIEFAAVGLGFVAGWSPAIQRLLANPRDVAAAVNAKAELEFYRIGMTTTAGRTGILLFLSLAERWAVVLADEAIAGKLSPETWTQVMNLMVAGGKNGALADGLIQAVDACSKLVAPLFPRTKDDRDEIRNQLRIV